MPAFTRIRNSRLWSVVKLTERTPRLANREFTMLRSLKLERVAAESHEATYSCVWLSPGTLIIAKQMITAWLAKSSHTLTILKRIQSCLKNGSTVQVRAWAVAGMWVTKSFVHTLCWTIRAALLHRPKRTEWRSFYLNSIFIHAAFSYAVCLSQWEILLFHHLSKWSLLRPFQYIYDVKSHEKGVSRSLESSWFIFVCFLNILFFWYMMLLY